jgi:hypothetical protein
MDEWYIVFLAIRLCVWQWQATRQLGVDGFGDNLFIMRLWEDELYVRETLTGGSIRVSRMISEG